MNRLEYDQYKFSVLSNGTIHIYHTKEGELCNIIYKQNKYLAESAALWKKGYLWYYLLSYCTQA